MRITPWKYFATRFSKFGFALSALLLGGCQLAPPDHHAPEAAGQVKAEFLHAWKGCERYAGGHDALKPLSRTAHDWYSQSGDADSAFPAVKNKETKQCNGNELRAAEAT